MNTHNGPDRARDGWDAEMDAAHTAHLDALGHCDALSPADVVRHEVRHDGQWLMVDPDAPGGVRELTKNEQRLVTEMLVAYQREHQRPARQREAELEIEPGDEIT